MKAAGWSRAMKKKPGPMTIGSPARAPPTPRPQPLDREGDADDDRRRRNHPDEKLGRETLAHESGAG